MRNPFFDEEAIRRDVPEGRLMRAENYLEKGWVELVDIGLEAVLAHVRGEYGDLYVVHMGEADGADARCSCKDFQATGRACKHIVATAKRRNQLSAAELREAQGRMARLEEGLAMGSTELIARVIAWARNEPGFLRALEGAED